MNFNGGNNGEAAGGDGGRLLQALLAGNFGPVSIAIGAAACTTAWTALREEVSPLAARAGGVTANSRALAAGAFLGGMATFWIGVWVTAGGRHRRQNMVGFINFILSLVAWVVASAYYGKFEPGHVFDIYNELP